ncbi:hypothetical protein UlMin_038006 [Ulmus minor]
MEDVVIVGAGIAGVATALALNRVGIKALVLERSDGLRTTGAALSLSQNAWLALDALGVSHKLTSIYTPIERVFYTNLKSGAIQQVSFSTRANANGVGPRLVHRKALLEALAEELPVDSIRFSCKIKAIDAQQQEGSSITVVHLEDGTVIKSKVLIGCDGIHSVVAKWLGLAEPVHSGRSAVRGLTVYPQGHGLKKEVHQLLGTSMRAGFLPITDTDIYWFFVSSSQGTNLPTDPKVIQSDILENHGKNMPEQYLDIVRHADVSTLTWAPLRFRLPWKVAFGNLSKQNVTVAGDAMHPMTPNLGQGGCAALEDAVVLGRHIGNSFLQNGRIIVPTEMCRAIEKYVEERKWRATWLIVGSYLRGWVQDGGSLWGLEWFRNFIFYKFIFPRIARVIYYDCGKLPF